MSMNTPCSRWIIQIKDSALKRYGAEVHERDVTAMLNQIYAHEASELHFALAALQTVSIPPERWS